MLDEVLSISNEAKEPKRNYYGPAGPKVGERKSLTGKCRKSKDGL